MSRNSHKPTVFLLAGNWGGGVSSRLGAFLPSSDSGCTQPIRSAYVPTNLVERPHSSIFTGLPGREIVLGSGLRPEA